MKEDDNLYKELTEAMEVAAVLLAATLLTSLI